MSSSWLAGAECSRFTGYYVQIRVREWLRTVDWPQAEPSVYLRSVLLNPTTRAATTACVAPLRPSFTDSGRLIEGIELRIHVSDFVFKPMFLKIR